MKNITIVLFAMLSATLLSAQQNMRDSTGTINAIYQGHQTEGYYFTDEKDGKKKLFIIRSRPILRKFDLESDYNVGNLFQVSYAMEKVGNLKMRVITDIEMEFDAEPDEQD